MAAGEGPVVFLDRDGTINEEIGYLHDPALLSVYPESIAGIRKFNDAGWKVFVVTNQSGIARGYTAESQVRAINERLVEVLRQGGARVDQVYYCPHHPLEACVCRKPKPGMVEEALREHRLTPSVVAVVGDKAADVELARNVGARAVLVTTGYGEETRKALKPDYAARHLDEAASWLLAQR